jgi:hypothetical protein
MRFAVTEESRPQYKAFLQERSDLINDCNVFLNDACQKAGDAYRAGNVGDLTVIALVRHAVESLDGVSLLLAQGSVLSCYPLLRTTFDASLGVCYILECDSDNRGLAYFVAQLNLDKALFERCDPSTNRGREIRKELQDDIAGPTAFDKLPLQAVQKHLAALQADLDSPEFQLVQEAWTAKSKTKKDPEWYFFFDNATNLRELAKRLRYLSGYELHYRPWCRQVHATATLKSLSSNDDAIKLRPIRHPDGIHEIVRSAGVLAITLAARVIGKYDPDSITLEQRYKGLEERIRILSGAIAPEWED